MFYTTVGMHIYNHVVGCVKEAHLCLAVCARSRTSPLLEPACHNGITQTDLPVTRHRQHSRPYLGQYSIYPPIKDERLSRPEPTQANNLPRVATEVPAIGPTTCQLVKPAFCDTKSTAGVNNLPTVVTQWPASAGFELESIKHESNTLSTLPPRHPSCNAPQVIRRQIYNISTTKRRGDVDVDVMLLLLLWTRPHYSRDKLALSSLQPWVTDNAHWLWLTDVRPTCTCTSICAWAS